MGRDYLKVGQYMELLQQKVSASSPLEKQEELTREERKAKARKYAKDHNLADRLNMGG